MGCGDAILSPVPGGILQLSDHLPRAREDSTTRLACASLASKRLLGHSRTWQSRRHAATRGDTRQAATSVTGLARIVALMQCSGRFDMPIVVVYILQRLAPSCPSPHEAATSPSRSSSALEKAQESKTKYPANIYAPDGSRCRPCAMKSVSRHPPRARSEIDPSASCNRIALALKRTRNVRLYVPLEFSSSPGRPAPSGKPGKLSREASTRSLIRHDAACSACRAWLSTPCNSDSERSENSCFYSLGLPQLTAPSHDTRRYK